MENTVRNADTKIKNQLTTKSAKTGTNQKMNKRRTDYIGLNFNWLVGLQMSEVQSESRFRCQKRAAKRKLREKKQSK